MKFFMLLPVFVFCLLIASPVKAGEVLACGVPDYETVQTSDDKFHGFCDIYQRQLDYRQERLAYIESLKQRQENFAKARKAAYEQYKKDLDKMHGWDE